MSRGRTHSGSRGDPRHSRSTETHALFGRRHFTLLVVLAVSAAGCLRLNPSEKPDTDSNESSTGSENSESSDTEDRDTGARAHPCDGVSCLKRPESRSCAEGKLTIVSGDGYCDLDSGGTPRCRFDTEQVECPSGKCADAKHCSESPCHGVRCDNPPPNSCGDDTGEENQLIVREREGRCQAGDTDSAPGCVYDIAETIKCPDGGCDTDTIGGAHCAAEPCLGVVCNRPPARYCEDANTLVVWNLYGRCGDDGSCVYNKRTVNCSSNGGCKNGRCAGEKCKGMLCYRPPARYCASKETVVQFFHAGTCDTSGGCVYREKRQDCPDSNCAGGNCGSQVCLDSSACYMPPAQYCTSEGWLVFWNAIRLCEKSRCTYYKDRIQCDEGLCRDGQCTKDPCAGEQWSCPHGTPAPYCADDDHVVISHARACEPSDLCDYDTDTNTEPCPGGCEAGVCMDDAPAAAPRGAER